MTSKQSNERDRLHHSVWHHIEPLNCDRWVASSLLQKAIRRSETEFALQAAWTFLKFDKAAIWCRLIVIAFEDVGAGDVDAVLETVFLASSSERRRKQGELAALNSIVLRLADADKDRSADYLACAGSDHPELAEFGEFCGKASLGQLLGIVGDTSRAFAERAVAASFSSGIDRQSGQQAQQGDLAALGQAYRELGVSGELVSSTVLAAKRTRDAMIVLLPLIWLEVQRGDPISVRSDSVPETKTIAGIPLYAFDKHTRLGKRAIERLIAENKPFRDCIVRFLAQGSPRKAAEVAAFYADGAPVLRRLDWAQSDSLQQLGMEADFAAAGLRLEGIVPVREAMNAALEHLNEIRAELWTAALATMG